MMSLYTLYRTAVLATLLSAPTYPLRAQAPSPLRPGIWLGAIHIQGIKLRIVFTIAYSPDGKLSATCDSPDQGAKGIPVNPITFVNDSLLLAIPSINGSFRGRYNRIDSTIAGVLQQGPGSLPLHLRWVEKVDARPQEPKKPYPYREEEVVYQNKKDNVQLAATLTLPKGTGPFPAVILISGSGAQDRNETILGHQPFWVIADYLSRQGIAVLRVDDRGVGQSSGSFRSATSEDFATDVLAGIDYLLSRQDIQRKHIGLLGHSEGGLIAPIVAVRSKAVNFLVLLAGPGVPGTQVLLTQNDQLNRLSGQSEAYTAAMHRLNERIYEVILSETDAGNIREKVTSVIDQEASRADATMKPVLAIVKSSIATQLPLLTSSWMKFLLAYDPRPTLKKVTCPVLALNGEKDVQVAANANLAAIGQALSEGGNKQHIEKALPGLNHLFQTANTGLPAEYATLDETFSPEVLTLLTDWIIKQEKHWVHKKASLPTCISCQRRPLINNYFLPVLP